MKLTNDEIDINYEQVRSEDIEMNISENINSAISLIDSQHEVSTDDIKRKFIVSSDSEDEVACSYNKRKKLQHNFDGEEDICKSSQESFKELQKRSHLLNDSINDNETKVSQRNKNSNDDAVSSSQSSKSSQDVKSSENSTSDDEVSKNSETSLASNNATNLKSKKKLLLNDSDDDETSISQNSTNLDNSKISSQSSNSSQDLKSSETGNFNQDETSNASEISTSNDAKPSKRKKRLCLLNDSDDEETGISQNTAVFSQSLKSSQEVKSSESDIFDDDYENTKNSETSTSNGAITLKRKKKAWLIDDSDDDNDKEIKSDITMELNSQSSVKKMKKQRILIDSDDDETPSQNTKNSQKPQVLTDSDDDENYTQNSKSSNSNVNLSSQSSKSSQSFIKDKSSDSNDDEDINLNGKHMLKSSINEKISNEFGTEQEENEGKFGELLKSRKHKKEKKNKPLSIDDSSTKEVSQIHKKKTIRKKDLLEDSDSDPGAEFDRLMAKYEDVRNKPRTEGSVPESLLDSSSSSSDSGPEDRGIVFQREPSDSDELDCGIGFNSELDDGVKKKPPKQKKESRRAREKALFAIHRESQRLLRETSIQMPYYRAPKLSLEEFLNRRKRNVSLPLDLKPSRSNTEQILAAESLTRKKNKEDGTKLDSTIFKDLNPAKNNQDNFSESFHDCNHDSDKKEDEDVIMKQILEMLVQSVLKQIDPDTIVADTLESLLQTVMKTVDSDAHTVNHITKTTVSSDFRNENICESSKLEAPHNEISKDLPCIQSAGSNQLFSDDFFEDLLIEDQPKNELSELKQKVINSAKSFTPKLSGAPGDFIDLDDNSSEPVQTGFDNFIEKFLEHSKVIRKKRSPQEVKLNIVSKDDIDPLKLQLSDISVKVNIDEEDESELEKPGTKIFKLKEHLLNEIIKKKEKSLIKRQEIEKMYEEEEFDPEEEEADLFDDADSENNGENEDADMDESDGSDNENIIDGADLDDGDHDEDGSIADDEDDMGSDGDDSLSIPHTRKKKKNPFIDDEASDDEFDKDYKENSESIHSSSSKNSNESHTSFSGIFPKKNSQTKVEAEALLSGADDTAVDHNISEITCDKFVMENDVLLEKLPNKDQSVSLIDDSQQLDASNCEFPSLESVFKSPLKTSPAMNQSLTEEEKTANHQSETLSDNRSKLTSPLLFASSSDSKSEEQVLGIQSTMRSPFWKLTSSYPKITKDNTMLDDCLDDEKINVSRVAKELCFNASPPSTFDILDACSGTFGTRPLSDDDAEIDDSINVSHSQLSISQPDVDDDYAVDNEPVTKKYHRIKTGNDLSSEDEHEESINNNFLSNIKDNEIDDGNDDIQPEIQMKKVEDFFEDEAELSGSDVGSDVDEDVEDGEYEEDFIPNEELPSDDELRDQIGKVHLKQVLDEDKRQLKLYQELYLEDGELHDDGPGRQRKFTWLNSQGGDDFLGEHSGNSESEQEDNVTEEQWRIERHERQKFLQEQQDKGVLVENSPVRLKKRNSFKIEILNKSQEQTTVVEKNAPQMIYNSKATQISRASFLARGEDYLNCLTKKFKKTDNDSSGLKTTKHFVFRAVSPSKISPVTVPSPKVSTFNKEKKFPLKKPKKRGSIFDLLD